MDDFVAHLQGLEGYAGQVVHVEHLHPQMPLYADLARPLPEALVKALRAEGVERLYTHQVQAIDAVRDGRHVMLISGTASGKTMAYNLPVLTAILADPLTRALYLYPTKALAQDQMRALRLLTRHPGLRDVTMGHYDGDTPQSVRTRIRKQAQIVLSNPDMLHMGILPNHGNWAAFWRHLRYVVIDEAHVYRGIFGSHVACVLRRLLRVCAAHGHEPQFILCSATIGNPAQLGRQLTGLPVQVVDEDGAPKGPRQFVVWNPPYDAETGHRVSINTEAAHIICELAKATLRSITFVKSRKLAELLLIYARDLLRREKREALGEQLASYRGGYMAEERRAIERRLFAGELLGVISTNALELGIDVGQLDASVMVGYPGAIASLWQQAGRAGRSERSALAVMLAYDDPLDQYYCRHPEQLFERPHEQALCNPSNPYVLLGHLLCAAQERPLTVADAERFGDDMLALLDALVDEGQLELREGRWLYLHDDYPAQQVSLRSSGGEDYLLLDVSRDNALMERVDGGSALFRIHPGAIHLHRGQAYLISELDVERRLAWAQPVDVDYYTQPREINDVRIIRSLEAQETPLTEVYWGQVRVTQQVIGYQRKRRFTDALLDQTPLDLPSETIETEALWFEVPKAICAEVAKEGLDLAGGAARRRARLHRRVAVAGHVRPQRHRRAFDRGARRHRAAASFCARRLCGRGRHRAHWVREHPRAVGGGARCCGQLCLRVGLSLLYPLAQVWRQQRAPRQGGGYLDPAKAFSSREPTNDLATRYRNKNQEESDDNVPRDQRRAQAGTTDAPDGADRYGAGHRHL